MINPEIEEKIILLYESELSLNAIASKVFVSPTTVKNVLLRLGFYCGNGKPQYKKATVKIQPKDPAVVKRNAAIKRMRKRGKTLKHIAAYFNLSVERVRQILK